MDIEELSKSQLLLLTILVNFVVSIATGVLTVSLLDQAPATVTQTVNRIVDHTIETVTTQVPVIGAAPEELPSSEDLLTAAIAADAARTVLVFRAGVDEPAASGLYVPASRSVVTISEALPRSVRVVFPNGSELEAELGPQDGSIKRYVFAEDATLPEAPASPFAAPETVKQGQTVIALTLDGRAVTGIVSRIDAAGIQADLPQIGSGAAIVNLSGDVLGLHAGAGLFLTADRLKALLSSAP